MINAIEEYYDEMLDECYPIVVIGATHFFASTILKKCDPIAYHQGLLDFEGYLKENEELNK
jgi:hypothetical protein